MVKRSIIPKFLFKFVYLELRRNPLQKFYADNIDNEATNTGYSASRALADTGIQKYRVGDVLMLYKLLF